MRNGRLYGKASGLRHFPACRSRHVSRRKACLEESQMASNVNPSGLTDDECQEFHKYYIQGYLLWAAGAFFAHSLVWIWRPWF